MHKKLISRLAMFFCIEHILQSIPDSAFIARDYYPSPLDNFVLLIRAIYKRVAFIIFDWNFQHQYWLEFSRVPSKFMNTYVYCLFFKSHS